MFLPDTEIRYLVDNADLIRDFGLSPDVQIQPNGCDLTVKSIHSFDTEGELKTDSKTIPVYGDINWPQHGIIYLRPGGYFMRLNETVTLPTNMIALARPRSTLVRSGVTVGTGVWDAGYTGQSGVSLFVHHPRGFRIHKNAPVLQLVFAYLNDHVGTPYNGSYQNE